MRKRPVLVLLALMTASYANASSYSAYNTAVSGSARRVGLAGSIVALPDGYAATFLNPAGLSGLSGKGIDFGSDANTVDDFVVDLDNPKARGLNFPLKYSYSGFRFASTRGWGFGFVASTPFQVDNTFLDGTTVRKPKGAGFVINNSQTRVRLSVDTYTLAAAKTLGEAWAIGASADFNRVRETYDYSAANGSLAHLDRSRDAWSGSLGLLGRPARWLGLGAVYRSGFRAGFDPTLNAGIQPPGTNWFRDVKMPERIAAGLVIFPWRDRLRLYLQTNYVPKTSDTVLVGTGLFAGQAANVSVGQSDSVDGHWGLELIPVDYPDLTVKLWAGGYLENTGVQGGYSRYHRTAGLQLSPWFIDFSAAVDDADLYNNFSIGLGVDLLQLSSRVARHYGWKLPI